MNAPEEGNTTSFMDENHIGMNAPSSVLIKQKGTAAREKPISPAQEHGNVSVANISAEKPKISEPDNPKLAMQLAHEQSGREKLKEEQLTETYQRDRQVLLESNKALKTQINDLHDQQKEREVSFNKLEQDHKDVVLKNEQLDTRIAILNREKENYKQKLKSLKKLHQVEREVWIEEQSELKERITELEKRVSELLAGQPQTPTDESSRQEIDHIIFGQEAWESYLGNVGEVPPLPTDLDDILNASCPFWPQHKVRDTHLLVLIPSKVNGESFTLNRLNTLAECSHRDDCGTRFYYYAPLIKDLLGRVSPSDSYWALIANNIVPNHNYFIGENSEVLLRDELVDSGYTVPSTLEVTTAILSHHLYTGEYIFPSRYPDGRCVYTRCYDQALEKNPAVVGGLSSLGINLYSLEYATNFFDFDIGVAPARKL